MDSTEILSRLFDSSIRAAIDNDKTPDFLKEKWKGKQKERERAKKKSKLLKRKEK